MSIETTADQSSQLTIFWKLLCVLNNHMAQIRRMVFFGGTCVPSYIHNDKPHPVYKVDLAVVPLF